MALVSDKYNFIFFHIYKTAGMSIRHSVFHFDEDAYEIVRGHSDIKEVLEMPDYEKYISYTKFSVVRNPYTWLYSIYKFSQNLSTHPFHIISHLWEFDYFVNWLIHHTDFINEKKVLNGKLQTQTEYLAIDGKISIDYILKYESLDDDYMDLMDKLNVPYYTALPKENIGVYEMPNFNEILNRDTLDRINDYYNNDFINFNYEKL